MSKILGAVLLAIMCVASFASDNKELKPVVVYLEGDSSVIPKFINLCREKGPENGINFTFVTRKMISTTIA
jgi:hypothetical protein